MKVYVIWIYNPKVGWTDAEAVAGGTSAKYDDDGGR
jgi:hypothetical protein